MVMVHTAPSHVPMPNPNEGELEGSTPVIVAVTDPAPVAMKGCTTDPFRLTTPVNVSVIGVGGVGMVGESPLSQAPDTSTNSTSRNLAFNTARIHSP
jgi:hypothetical protein